jgi:hypothetical protein
MQKRNVTHHCRFEMLFGLRRAAIFNDDGLTAQATNIRQRLGNHLRPVPGISERINKRIGQQTLFIHGNNLRQTKSNPKLERAQYKEVWGVNQGNSRLKRQHAATD